MDDKNMINKIFYHLLKQDQHCDMNRQMDKKLNIENISTMY